MFKHQRRTSTPVTLNNTAIPVTVYSTASPRRRKLRHTTQNGSAYVSTAQGARHVACPVRSEAEKNRSLQPVSNEILGSNQNLQHPQTKTAGQSCVRSVGCRYSSSLVTPSRLCISAQRTLASASAGNGRFRRRRLRSFRRKKGLTSPCQHHGFSCCPALSPSVLLSASELHKHPPITKEAPNGLGNGSPRVDDANPAPTNGSKDWITVASEELGSTIGDGGRRGGS